MFALLGSRRSVPARTIGTAPSRPEGTSAPGPSIEMESPRPDGALPVGRVAAVNDPKPLPPTDDGEEIEVDIRSFLPEGVSVVGATEPDLPEPEIPAWALDPEPEADAEATEGSADPDGTEQAEQAETSPTDDASPPEPDEAEAAPVAHEDVASDDEEAISDAEEAASDDGATAPEVAVEVESVTLTGVVTIDELAPDEPVPPAWAIADVPSDTPTDGPTTGTEPVAVEPPEVEVGDEPVAIGATDHEPAVEDEPTANDEPTIEDEPTVEDEPTIEDEEPAGEEDVAAPEESDLLDTSVLERIEAEFTEVEEALAAIDAGDLDRSPLLVRLLANA